MNTIAAATFASITLAVSVLALPAVASAQVPNAGNAPISANGHLLDRHGWLTTLGPDAQGRYTMWINVADLDAGTAAGKARMVARIERGAAVLCDMTADGPQFAGYFDGGARQCRAEARAAALARVGSGQQVSMLTLGAAKLTR